MKWTKLVGLALLCVGVVGLLDPKLFSNFSLLSVAPAPTTGGVKLVVVKVEFLDITHRDGDDSTVASWLTELNDYYHANSYGRMWWDVTLLPNWYRLPKNIDDYGPSHLIGETGFLTDASALFLHDIAVNDVSKVALLYAGQGPRSYSGWKDAVQVNNVELSVAIVSLWINGTPFTLEHECGHLLGLNDIYTANGLERIQWDGMGIGVAADGNALTFSSYNKLKLSWLDSESIKILTGSGASRVELAPLETSSGVRVIKIPVPKPLPGDPDRYYLVEVRSGVGVFVISIAIDFVDNPRWICPRTNLPAERAVDAYPFQVGDFFECPYFSLIVRSKSESSYSLDITIFLVTVTVSATTSVTQSATSTLVVTSTWTSATTIISTKTLTTTTGGTTSTSTTTLTQSYTSIQSTTHTVVLSTSLMIVTTGGRTVVSTATFTKEVATPTFPSSLAWLIILAGLVLFVI